MVILKVSRFRPADMYDGVAYVIITVIDFS